MAFKGSILALLLVAICHVNARHHHKVAKKFQVPGAVSIGALPAASSYSYPNCPCYNSYMTQGTPCGCASAVEDIEKKAKEEKKVLVVHLDFDKETNGLIKDKSNFGNDGQMHEGAILVNFPNGKCGNAVYTWDGDILFHGDTFQAKPRYGITISAYILMRKTAGMHELFDTIGSSHTCGQYHFEINDGNIRWFHRDETQKTVFNCEALGGLVKAGQWAHVAGTYDAVSGKAKVYFNGELRNMTIGSGVLSRDWAMRAGIGDHKVFRSMNGYIDEFMIHNYALSSAEIKKLATKCSGYKPAPVKVVGTKKKPFFDADVEATADQLGDAANDMADTDLLDDTTDSHNNELSDNLAESEADDTAEPVSDMTQDDSKLDHNEETVEEAVLKRSEVAKE